MRIFSETSGTILNTPIFKLKGSQKHKRKRKGQKIFEEIIVENFLNMGKEIIKSKKHIESHTG